MKGNTVFQNAIADVINGENMQLTKTFIQHGNVSVFAHSMAVAAYSVKLAQLLRIRCNTESLVRGAVLHDFFLYDWHKTSNIGDGLHGFAHPFTAWKNATKEYNLSDLEQDIIKKHMWPLTITKIPRHRESWLVCIVDKYCSLLETFHLSKYSDESFIDTYTLEQREDNINE